MNLPSWLKTLFNYGGVIVATVIATTGWATTHAVDLYALWNQMNVIVSEIGKFIASATPIVLAIWGIYRSTAEARINEISNNPAEVQKVRDMPVTSQTIALGDALKK